MHRKREIMSCCAGLCQHSTAQRSTTQDSPAKHGTQNSKAWHNTAQHSTAQTARHGTKRHSTAWHETAQHSMAWHSTAWQCTARSASPAPILKPLPRKLMSSLPNPPLSVPSNCNSPCQDCGIAGVLARIQSHTTCTACHAGCWPGHHL